MSRATKAIREQRIEALLDLLVGGVNRRGILTWVAQQGWGLSERQVDSYVALARTRLTELGRADRDYELGRSAARLQLLYAKSYAAGNLQLALQSLRALTQLLGLNAASDVEISGQLDLRADREELARRVAELFASGRLQDRGDDDEAGDDDEGDGDES